MKPEENETGCFGVSKSIYPTNTCKVCTYLPVTYLSNAEDKVDERPCFAWFSGSKI